MRFLTALLLAAAPLAAQSPAQSPAAETRFTAEQARRDLTILRRTLVELHPGLYRYLTPAQFDSAADAALAGVAGGATRGELYLAATRLAAAVRCGHTWTNPLNQGRGVQAELLARRDKLPLRLTLVEDRFLVQASAVDGIAAGDELLAIDGHRAADVVREMLPYLRADGSSDGKRRMQLTHVGATSAMDDVWPLLHPPAGGRYALLVRRRGSASATLRDAAVVTPAARDSLLAARGVAAPSFEWTLGFGDGVATLVIPTFVVRGRTGWAEWLGRAFASIDSSGARALVVDIRRNEGGDAEAVDSLLSHLLRVPYVKPATHAESAYERVPYVLARFLDTWDFGFFDRTERVTRTAGRNWRITGRDTARGVVPPAARPFRGRTFLLVSGENSSAGYLMARFAKESGAALLVGEPTGGNYRGLNGGELAWVTLPNSGVAVDVPLVASIAELPQPDSPVLPDALVRHTFADAERGIDPDVAEVRRRLRPPRR